MREGCYAVTFTFICRFYYFFVYFAVTEQNHPQPLLLGQVVVSFPSLLDTMMELSGNRSRKSLTQSKRATRRLRILLRKRIKGVTLQDEKQSFEGAITLSR